MLQARAGSLQRAAACVCREAGSPNPGLRPQCGCCPAGCAWGWLPNLLLTRPLCRLFLVVGAPPQSKASGRGRVAHCQACQRADVLELKRDVGVRRQPISFDSLRAKAANYVDGGLCCALMELLSIGAVHRRRHWQAMCSKPTRILLLSAVTGEAPGRLA